MFLFWWSAFGALVRALRLSALFALLFAAPLAARPAGPEAFWAARLYDATWLDRQAPRLGGAEWRCLTEAIYHEARGESLRGQFAVAEVVRNRARAPGFPASICAVVYERRGPACQFSFACAGPLPPPQERQAYRRAGIIAALVLSGARSDLTGGALYFHAGPARPAWTKGLLRTATLGAHRFYRARS